MKPAALNEVALHAICVDRSKTLQLTRMLMSPVAGDETVTPWKSYEEVAAYLLDQFACEFGLERVEGKQVIRGLQSGTNWEIDAKGVRRGNTGFLIIECHRYTTSRQNQGKVGSLAYCIIDTGAAGGIVVSPLGLQEGAEKMAAAENIVSMQLDQNSTRHEYVLRFLNKVMVGLADSLPLSGSLEFELRDKSGNVL